MAMRRIVALALLAATTVAIAAGTTAWRRVDQPLAQRGTSTEPDFDAFHVAMVEGMRPQARAEAVLQMAINGYSGASDYAIANAQSWRGEVEPTATLEAMLETALASPRIEVRMAALEVTIARSDLAKTAQQVDALVAQRRGHVSEAVNVDERRVDARALHQTVEHLGRQLRRVHTRQRTVALANGRPDRLDNDRFSHELLL